MTEQEDKQKEEDKKKKARKQGDIGVTAADVAAGDQGTTDNVPKAESTANLGPSNPY